MAMIQERPSVSQMILSFRLLLRKSGRNPFLKVIPPSTFLLTLNLRQK